jgi:glycosyltransferase involved in cell wall biosynthesis
MYSSSENSNLDTELNKDLRKEEARSQEFEKKSQIRYHTQKPLVSLVAPAYNEQIIIEQNLNILCAYMKSLENQYRWELIIVNDGSSDNTGQLADRFAQDKDNVYVIHHLINCGLGQTLRTGFEHCQGEYIITLDLDLSYAPDNHIKELLTKIRESQAKVVVASPYMKGGRVSNVPWLRWILSVWGNRFLSFTANGSLATLTSMVRVYDAEFLKTLNLKSRGMEINPEVIHKAKLLQARVAEIPAHLKWSSQRGKPKSQRRKSSMTSARIFKHTLEVVFFGFIFRPVIFFILPSLLFFLISSYASAWVVVHCWSNYQNLIQQNTFSDQAVATSAAVAAAFRQAPHTFLISGMSLMLSIQLFSLGVLSMQSKQYFDEMFYLGTSIFKVKRRNKI